MGRMNGVKRWKAVATWWWVAAIALVTVACGNGAGSGDVVPDSTWELLSLEFDGRAFDEPLLLSSREQLFGGSGACNDFGVEADGTVVQTAVGCDDESERVDEALINAVQGRRQLDGERLTIEGSFATVVLRPIVLPTPVELFSVLASDAPDIDLATLIFDEEAGGPPQDWDRMIRVDADIELAEFVIGSNGHSVCSHIGLATERPTSGSSCQPAHRLQSRFFAMVVGYPEPVVHAGLIPDAFLSDGNVQRLQEFGTVMGNFFVINLDTAVNLTLTDGEGNSYELDRAQIN